MPCISSPMRWVIKKIWRSFLEVRRIIFHLTTMTLTFVRTQFADGYNFIQMEQFFVSTLERKHSWYNGRKPQKGPHLLSNYRHVF